MLPEQDRGPNMGCSLVGVSQEFARNMRSFQFNTATRGSRPSSWYFGEGFATVTPESPHLNPVKNRFLWAWGEACVMQRSPDQTPASLPRLHLLAKEPFDQLSRKKTSHLHLCDMLGGWGRHPQPPTGGGGLGWFHLGDSQKHGICSYILH
jgi:hypothetical protein